MIQNDIWFLGEVEGFVTSRPATSVPAGASTRMPRRKLCGFLHRRITLPRRRKSRSPLNSIVIEHLHWQARHLPRPDTPGTIHRCRAAPQIRCCGAAPIPCCGSHRAAQCRRRSPADRGSNSIAALAFPIDRRRRLASNSSARFDVVVVICCSTQDARSSFHMPCRVCRLTAWSARTRSAEIAARTQSRARARLGSSFYRYFL